jgi:hypothetical protein
MILRSFAPTESLMISAPWWNRTQRGVYKEYYSRITINPFMYSRFTSTEEIAMT